MKPTTLFVFLALAMLSLLGSCREDDVWPEQAKVKKIMEALPGYKLKSIDVSGHGQQNGNIYGYFDGKELKMATSSAYGIGGRTEESYFFHNEKLIAVQEHIFRFNAPEYMTEDIAKITGDSVWYDETKVVMKVSWCYFYNSHLVKWIDTSNRIVPESAPQFGKKEEQLQHNAGLLKEMLLTKTF